MIVESSWNDIKNNILGLNPELAQIITKINPSDQYKIYRASYSFGDMIMSNGKFNVPINNQILAIDNQNVPSNISNDLSSYNGMPFGILLNKSFETFVSIGNRVIPFEIIEPGVPFSLWKNLDSEISFQGLFKWNVCAGSRSIFVLPKISDNYSHQKLQKILKIDATAPRSLEEQWKLFVEIYNVQKTIKPWHLDVLFFSKKWIDSAKSNPEWFDLHRFLLKRGWETSSFWRNEVAFRLIYNKFIEALTEKGIKSKPKILAIVKHLILIGLGLLPGFCPAIDEQFCPLNLLQSSYIEHYQLKDYIPTIMRPKYFSLEDQQPVYFSLQWDTLLEPYQEDKSQINVMDLLEDVLKTMEYFTSFIQNKNANFEIYSTPLQNITKVKYEYYHNSQSYLKDVKHTKSLIEFDERFLYLKNNDLSRKFCDSAHFVRGCIKISAIESK